MLNHECFEGLNRVYCHKKMYHSIFKQFLFSGESMGSFFQKEEILISESFQGASLGRVTNVESRTVTA